MYKLYETSSGATGILKQNNDGSITSFLESPDNTDYQQFKQDIANGVELQDADGKPITDVTQFMKGLP